MRNKWGDLLEGGHYQGWQWVPPGADQAEEGQRGDGCKIEQEMKICPVGETAPSAQTDLPATVGSLCGN